MLLDQLPSHLALMFNGGTSLCNLGGETWRQGKFWGAKYTTLIWGAVLVRGGGVSFGNLSTNKVT